MHLLNQWLPEPLAREVAETEPGRFRAVVALLKSTWQEGKGLPGGGGTLKWVSVVNRSVNWTWPHLWLLSSQLCSFLLLSFTALPSAQANEDCWMSEVLFQTPVHLPPPSLPAPSFLLISFIDSKADLLAADVEELVQIALEIILYYVKELFTQVRGGCSP